MSGSMDESPSRIDVLYEYAFRWHDEAMETFRSLEEKANRHVTVAGVFLGFVFLYVMETVQHVDHSLETRDKCLLGITVASLLVSIICGVVAQSVYSQSMWPNLKALRTWYVHVAGGGRHSQEAALVQIQQMIYQRIATQWPTIRRRIWWKKLWAESSKGFLLAGATAFCLLMLSILVM